MDFVIWIAGKINKSGDDVLFYWVRNALKVVMTKFLD
jgi:hypothetical protein